MTDGHYSRWLTTKYGGTYSPPISCVGLPDGQVGILPIVASISATIGTCLYVLEELESLWVVSRQAKCTDCDRLSIASDLDGVNQSHTICTGLYVFK
jgi:hypothetical protein